MRLVGLFEEAGGLDKRRVVEVLERVVAEKLDLGDVVIVLLARFEDSRRFIGIQSCCILAGYCVDFGQSPRDYL